MADGEDKKPVMDVEKPGTTPASATSRPLIITKGPAIKDPMVTADAEAEDDTKEAQVPLPSAKKKTIQPISEQPPQQPEGEQSSQPAENAEVSTEDIAPELPAEGDSGVKPKDPAEERSEEDVKRQELVDKLVQEKKYFVPIGAVQKRRTARAVIVLGVLLLGIIGAVAAIDAGLIKTNITLPFDLL